MTAARAAQTQERAAVLRVVPPADRDRLVNAFLADDADVGRRTPTPIAWQDLQQQEHYEIDEIADAATRILFGTRAGFTPRQSADLEQGATYLVRRIQPTFVNASQAWAAEVLQSCSEFQVLTIGRSATERTVMAHRIVACVRASLHAVLEAHTPIAPSVYLKAAAERKAK